VLAESTSAFGFDDKEVHATATDAKHACGYGTTVQRLTKKTILPLIITCWVLVVTCSSTLVQSCLQLGVMLALPGFLLLCCLTLLYALLQLPMHTMLLLGFQCFQAAMLGHCHSFNLNNRQ